MFRWLKEKLYQFNENFRYPINRPLDDNERALCLPTNEATSSPPWPQAAVIKMNSTYLECCNAEFGRKGMATIVSIVMLATFIWLWVAVMWDAPTQWARSAGNRVGLVFILAFLSIVVLIASAMAIHILSLESFQLTHYPQRFNRKTRMVHCFLLRGKGKILSIPWDEVCFTLVEDGSGHQVRGHQLAKDGTVLATFALASSDSGDSPWCFSQWEFIRRYMEEGPEQLEDMVDVVMDIADRRESFFRGIQRLYHGFSGQFFMIGILFSPLALIFGPGRWISNLTCRIPRWPKEIEDTCQIAPDDPYIRDGQNLAPYGAAFRHMKWK